MRELNAVVCTVAQAAAFFHVSPKTVRSWITRYAIAEAPRERDGVNRYRLDTLAEAEFRARNNAGGRPRKSSAKALASPV